MDTQGTSMLEGHLQALLAGLFLAAGLNFMVARTYGPNWLRPLMLYAALVTLGWSLFYIVAAVGTFNQYPWFASLADAARMLQFFNVAGLLATGILVAAPFWAKVFHRRGSVEGERMSCGKSP